MIRPLEKPETYTYIKRTVKYLSNFTNKKILNNGISEELVTELVPKNGQKKLAETIYQPVFYNGKLSSEIQTRTVYEDAKYGTRAVFEEKFPESPKAPSRKIEVTDRTSSKFESKGYGYGNENMTRLHERELSEDGSYIAKEHHEYNGCINVPNCKGSRTDYYNKDAHLHYIDGQLYRTNPPIFYTKIPNGFTQVQPK